MPIIKSFNMYIKKIFSDRMLTILYVTPIIIAIIFQFGIPFAHSFFRPYYLLFDLVLCILTPYLMCFNLSLEIMSGKRKYLLSHIVKPLIITCFASVVLVRIFMLSILSLGMIIVLSILSSILCATILMLNKINGIMFAKLFLLILIGLSAPFFVTSNIQYLFGIIPSFWISKLAQTGNLIYLLTAILCIEIWFRILMKNFKK